MARSRIASPNVLRITTSRGGSLPQRDEPLSSIRKPTVRLQGSSTMSIAD